jgi:hypothetical protein
MAIIKADISLLKTSYSTGMTNLGEAARAQDFWMTITGSTDAYDYKDMSWLIQSMTIPSIKREVVETVGQMGVRSIQQGRFINEIEMAITFKDVVTGFALQSLKYWTRKKEYLTVTLELVSESVSKPANQYTKWEISHCWLELDGVELSVEDAVPLKLSGTLHGSYFPPADRGSSVMVST